MIQRKEGSGGDRWWILTLVCMLVAAHHAQSQNRGVYPLGMSAINSGFTPEPGFSYSNQFLYYSRNEAKDEKGNTLPVTGQNYVAMDMNSLIWVSTRKPLLNARYSATATLPFAKNDLTSNLQGDISGGAGFADSYYMPLILGWSSDRFAVRAIYGFLAPTGRFVAGGTDNVGSGYWTHALSSGQTFYLTQTRRLSLSVFEMYEFHTTQEGTGTHPGDTFDLDYSLLTPLPHTSRRLHFGLAGYQARQVTSKTGPLITPAESAARYAINALGFAVIAAFPKQKASLGIKYFDEFANRSTYEGYSVQIQGAIHF
ncbi:MAG: transporter [Terracidiphilus sp.]